MGKSYSPKYVYPLPDSDFSHWDDDGDTLFKDIRDVPQESYGAWWPTFFPTSIGFLVTGNRERSNVMTISCMVVTCAHPFTVGFPVFGGERSTRGNGPRYSLDLLEAHAEFTLNVPCMSSEMTKRVIICGSLTGRDGTDKFAKAGFTKAPSRYVEPPILRQCPISLEAKVHSIQNLGTHNWVMGRVQAVHIDKSLATGGQKLVWLSMPRFLGEEGGLQESEE